MTNPRCWWNPAFIDFFQYFPIQNFLGHPVVNVHPVLIRMISEKSHNLEEKKEGTNDVLIAPFALQKSFVSSCKWVPKFICSLNKELENWLFFVRFVLANENGRGFNQEFI